MNVEKNTDSWKQNASATAQWCQGRNKMCNLYLQQANDITLQKLKPQQNARCQPAVA